MMGPSAPFQVMIARLRAQVAQLAAAASRPVVDTLVRAVLANRQQNADSLGPGLSGIGTDEVNFVLTTPIATTPGAPGKFQVTGMLSVITSAPSLPVRFTLTRGGVQIPGMVVDDTSDPVNSRVSATLSWDDPAFESGPGPYVYGVRAFVSGVGNTITSLTNAGSADGGATIEAQETF